jgi:hypothetical protein
MSLVKAPPRKLKVIAKFDPSVPNHQIPKSGEPLSPGPSALIILLARAKMLAGGSASHQIQETKMDI